MNHHPAQKSLAAACCHFVSVLSEQSDLRARIDKTRRALCEAAAAMDADDWQSHLALEHMSRASDGLKRLELLVNTIELDLCEALTEIRQSRALDSETWGEA
jgi:hypothetical protein